jgi:pimeloyl-ACP methyl ester carboxylesterase
LDYEIHLTANSVSNTTFYSKNNLSMNPFKRIAYLLLILILVYPIESVSAQSLRVEPYNFISRKNDSIPAELFTLRVPLDRSFKVADSIEIKFVRLKSLNPNPGTPIIYLAGGPGGSGIEAAKGGRFAIFNKLREVSDIILLDQRGTGMSNSIPNCPYKTSVPFSTPVEKQAYLDKSIEMFTNCFEFWESKNIRLWAYNTKENASDIDDIRKALNLPKISLWGLSYGSQLGFEYIRLFEKNVDRFAMAGLEGNEETIKLPKDNDDFLREISRLAADNYGSEVRYPGLLDKIKAVHQRVKNEPLFVPLIGPSGAVDTIGISNFELQTAITGFYMKNPEDSKRIPHLYSKMYEGDFSEIAQRVVVVKFYVINSMQPMALSMDLMNGISSKRNRTVNKQISESILETTPNFLFLEWMNTLSYSPLPDDFRRMKNNRVDALLFSGTLDGRTYLKSGIRIAKRFKNGHHMIVENGGHDLYDHSIEVNETLIKFFKGESILTKKITLAPVVFD